MYDTRTPQLAPMPGIAEWAPCSVLANEVPDPAEWFASDALGLGSRILVKSAEPQERPANGIYALTESGANVIPALTVHTGASPTIITGLLRGVLYSWSRGTFTTSLINGTQTLTQSGLFVAQATSIELGYTSQSTEDVLDTIRRVVAARASDADTIGEFALDKRVRVERGPWAGLWFVTQLGMALGTDDIVFDLLTPAMANPLIADPANSLPSLPAVSGITYLTTGPELAPLVDYYAAPVGAPRKKALGLSRPISVQGVRLRAGGRLVTITI
jgi:hypothetical protein